MKNQSMTDASETGGKSVCSLDIPIDFSLKDKTKPKEKVLAVLKFMRKLSNFEKRSAESNLLVGSKK